MGRKSTVWWWDRRGGWYSTIGGRRVLLAKGRGEKKEAERRLRKLLVAEAEKAKSIDEHGPSLDEIACKFLDAAERELAPLTYATYRRHIAPFCDRHGEDPATTLQPRHVEAWLAAKRWGPTTRHGATTSIKRLYRWAKTQGHIPADPMAEMVKPRPMIRDTILTPEQFAAILDATADRTWRDFLVALWSTGCRPNEVATVTAADVDLKVGVWRVVNKTRHCSTPTRTIHLTPAMVEMSTRLTKANPKGPIFRNPNGRPWNRKMMSGRFSRVRKKLGFGPEATAYSIRHLYATDALDKGVPVATVAELMGHVDTTMIMRVYSKLKSRSGHLRHAAEQVRPSSPPTLSGDEPPGRSGRDGSPREPTPPDPASASGSAAVQDERKSPRSDDDTNRDRRRPARG